MKTQEIKKKILKTLQSKQPVSIDGLLLQGQALILKTLDGDLKPLSDVRADAEDFVKKMKNGEEDLLIQQRLLVEEFEEYKTAEGDDKRLDALIDMIHVIMVMIVLENMPFDSAWKEISHSNRTKSTTKRGSGKMGGTVIKGKDYIAPRNLQELIDEWRQM